MHAVLYSGGADSALLLHKVLQMHDFDDVVVLHANFICDKTAPDQEANLQFVHEQLGTMGVTYHVEDLIVEDIGKGPEGNARAAFASLRGWAERYFDTVYIGHNRDDHIETVLIQLFRGAGKGTRGMPDEEVGKMRRPLLSMSRHEVRDECERRLIPYFSDPSNKDTGLTRVFMREKLIPLLMDHYGESSTYKRIENIGRKFEEL